MQSRITREIVLDALLMAVWRRKPALPVTVNSDQGSQHTIDKDENRVEPMGLNPFTQ